MARPTCFALPACLALELAMLLAAQAAEPLWLKETAAKGDVSRVASDFQMSAKVNVEIPGQGTQEATFASREREAYREEILATGPRGPTRVRRAYAVARSVDQEPGEAPKTTTSSRQGKTVQLTRKGGKTLVSVLRPAGGKLSAKDRKDLLDDLDQGDFQVFPDRAVSPGEEWEVDPESVKRVFGGAGTFDRASMKARFEEVVPFAGHSCARLRITLELGQKASDAPVQFSLNLTGDYYHAVDLQRMLSVKLTGPVKVSGSQGGFSVTGDGTATISYGQQWEKVAGKPVARSK